MTQFFELNNCRVSIEFREHSVHILNDGNLTMLIGQNPQLTTPQLVSFILEQYQLHFGHPFGVHPDSLAIEI